MPGSLTRDRSESKSGLHPLFYALHVLYVGETDGLKWWCGWALRSRLAPFRKLAKTIKAHWMGILAFMETRLTNAAMEAVNGILQLAKRMARGFRNFHYFRIMAYLKAGRLQLDVPHF